MEGNYSHLPLSISIEFIFSLLPNYIQKQIIWKIIDFRPLWHSQRKTGENMQRRTLIIMLYIGLM